MTASNGRILVAEDEVMIGMMIEDFLDILGYDLAAMCVSGAECYAAIDAQPAFDAAVLDCNLADGPVWAVARRLQSAGVPIIFASGDGGVGIPEDLRSNISIGKPYLMDALDRALSTALTRAD